MNNWILLGVKANNQYYHSISFLFRWSLFGYLSHEYKYILCKILPLPAQTLTSYMHACIYYEHKKIFNIKYFHTPWSFNMFHSNMHFWFSYKNANFLFYSILCLQSTRMWGRSYLNIALLCICLFEYMKIKTYGYFISILHH